MFPHLVIGIEWHLVFYCVAELHGSNLDIAG